MINFDEFAKLDIRIGTIKEASRIEGSDKLLRLTIDLGEETRQLVAGIGLWYKPEELIGKQLPILVNLEPKTIKGIESQGMMLAADQEGKPVLLHPDKTISSGAKVR